MISRATVQPIGVIHDHKAVWVEVMAKRMFAQYSFPRLFSPPLAWLEPLDTSQLDNQIKKCEKIDQSGGEELRRHRRWCHGLPTAAPTRNLTACGLDDEPASIDIFTARNPPASLTRPRNMLPEFQTVLSYFQAQADILRHDYGDILRIEMQSVDEFIDAATNLCQKISPTSPALLESGQSPSASVDTQTLGTDSEPESLPEIVMEFHRWAQGPPPPWLQEFEQFRSKMAQPTTQSVTEADIESVTEPDTEFERLLRSKTQSRAEPITESDTESVTEPDTEFERLLRSKTQSRAEPITESDTESVTEPDTEFERLLRSKTQSRAEPITESDTESVTEPDTEFERLLHSKTQPRAGSITDSESDMGSVTEPDTEFERPLRSMTQRRAESVTEPDTDSESKNFCRTETMTNPEYSLYRAVPAEFITTITQLMDQLYDLCSSASRTDL
ncbi:hypothetical protein F5887DRAFT_915914 [Amanita rubescens]|nr:hypothetical protein F5887DRAFT_915914 [Amanita rubescens]